MIFFTTFAIVVFIVSFVIMLREDEWGVSLIKASFLTILFSLIMIEAMFLTSVIAGDVCEHSIVNSQEKILENEYVISANIDSEMNFICQVKDEATKFLTTETISAKDTNLKIINEGEQPKLIEYKTDITNKIIKLFTFRSVTEKINYTLCVQNYMIQTSIIVK